MKMELIAAERLTFGEWRYRLVVRHRIGWLHWTRTYTGKESPLLGSAWYWNGSLVQGRQTLDGLNCLFYDALGAKRVPVRPLPAIDLGR